MGGINENGKSWDFDTVKMGRINENGKSWDFGLRDFYIVKMAKLGILI